MKRVNCNICFQIRAVLLYSLSVLAGGASAEEIRFPAGSFPTMTAPQGLIAGTRPSQLKDAAGHRFATTYDGSGRLAGLKRTTGRNIADMMVGYDASGRIYVVRFDNGYHLLFHYSSDGTEAVTDPLGGQIVRLSTGGGPFVVQSTSDASGHLTEGLAQVERVFALVQTVPGLNPGTGTEVR